MVDSAHFVRALKMCMKKFDAEKIFFDKQYAGGYQVSRTYCQVSFLHKMCCKMV